MIAVLGDVVKMYQYSASDKSWIITNNFLYCSMKTQVVGTQKNCLIETVLLSTHNWSFH